jgi:hypothetical protein
MQLEGLFKSRGHIPRSFLVGCGVPDTLIEYLPSHISVEGPGSFFSCFISHSSKDARFCERLYNRIRQAGLRVWYAPYDMRSGQLIDDQIETAIRIFDKLLVVLSPHSMESHWVRREIKKARMRERHEQRRVLFPLRLVSVEKLKSWECLDPDTGEDLAEEIRRFHIPDFSHSDDAAFDKALSRLLEDLRSLHAT